MKQLVETASSCKDIFPLIVTDDRLLFESQYNDKHEDCIDVSVFTNGLLAQILEQAGILNFNSVSKQLQSKLIDLQSNLEKEIPLSNEIKNLKIEILKTLDEYFFDF